jgi:uncharacterized protein (DUF1800 family)
MYDVAAADAQAGTDRDALLEHLLRRAGFGASREQLVPYLRRGLTHSVDLLLDYEGIEDTVDGFIGTPGYAGVTAQGGFTPNTSVAHARQRWLFRMIHTRRPLQEKMTLFWHNHFATAYSKVAGTYGATEGTRYMAAKPSEDPNGVKGQIELFREFAVGNFRDLLVAVAKDVAMLVWLDGRLNVRGRPQENFARELMELFTMGVATFAEEDVYAGARVFTGWNLARIGGTHNVFSYNAAQHDTAAKAFTFPIYPDGNRVIPARSADAGMTDGLDLINAVARHPETGPRLARKLYAFFVNDVQQPDQGLVADMARIYYENNFEMKPVLRHLFLSNAFAAPANRYARYSWPAEFVVRAIKEVGWAGFSVNDALTPMTNMGQQLFEPPDVNGWEPGPGWFSTGGMLARMNFAAALTSNQKFNIRDASREAAQTPEALVEHWLDRLTVPSFGGDARQALLDYARAGGAWSGTDTQLATKASGIAHLIVGSGEYQFV